MNSEVPVVASGPSPNINALLVAEYQARLERFRQIAGHQNQLQQWALVFTGGLWAWVLSRDQSFELSVAYWLPVAFNVLFYRKTRVLKSLADDIYARLNKITDWVGADEPQYVAYWGPEAGWNPWAKHFWYGLIVASGIAAIVYTVLLFF